MGYFTYLADAAFKTGPKGEFLFLLGGPWSKPLILVGDEQRDRTYKKHLWIQRIFFTTLILGQAFLFSIVPAILGHIFGFFGYLVTILMVQWLVQRVVFRVELQQCKRMDSRLPFTSFYQQMSDKNSSVGLLLGFLVCIAFVVCGIFMASSSDLTHRVNSIFVFLFFGAVSLGWGYALYLKSYPKIDS
jgi:hypothetical protein